jgi:hypothetical protein
LHIAAAYGHDVICKLIIQRGQQLEVESQQKKLEKEREEQAKKKGTHLICFVVGTDDGLLSCLGGKKGGKKDKQKKSKMDVDDDEGGDEDDEGEDEDGEEGKTPF